jgi:oxygen-independent coproporphyrinogen-3 oxidase
MRFAHLAALRLAGVNRLSVGAQSSNANALRAIGRRHSWKDVVQVVGDARRAGFENISLDLIYGLPGETLPVIKKTIADALGLGVTHMSVYGLQLEEGTALSGLADSGKVVLPDDDAQAAAYDLAGEMLNHSGFRQYEISNFAIPGCESRHNLIYWRNEPYLGLGPAAVSYIKGTRSTNARALVTYVSDIGAGRRGTAFSETLEPEGARSETMILGLRLNQGVDEESFATRFGAVPEAFYGDLIQELRADGWLRSDRLALTDKARPVASQILLRFV